MKIIKNCLYIILIAVLLFNIPACATNKLNEGEPTYLEEKTMFIGAFSCPYPSDEQYKLVAESGINHMVLNDRTDASVSSPLYYKKPFDYGEKYGVTIIPSSHNQPYTNFYRSEYVDKKSFGGFNVFDEPGADSFAEITQFYSSYKSHYPDLPYYVNLFPMYGTKTDFDTETYEEYVERYTDEVLSKIEKNRIMICDIYPLLKYSQIYNGWLRNLEILQENAKKVDAKLYIYIQDIAFSNRRQPASVDDLRFQCYTNMAFGTKGIYHFTYQTPTSDSAYPITSHSLVDREGKKTEVYDYAKTINTELLSFDDVFLSFNWDSVITNIGSENESGENANFKFLKNATKKFGCLSSYTSSKDMLVGNFKDGNNNNGYMAVNFTDPTLNLTNKIDLTFKGANKAIVYKKGVKYIINLENEHYKTTLEKGEGQFIIPFKV